jgi:hypothetical protein
MLATLAAVFPALLLTVRLSSPAPVLILAFAFLVFFVSSLIAVHAPPPPLAVGPVRWALGSLLHLPQLPWQAFVLRRAAHALGWTVPWWRWPSDIEGTVDGVPTRLSRPHLTALERSLAVSVAGLSSEIEIEPEGLRKLALKAVGVRDVVTGDSDFDRKLFVQGAPVPVFAILDADTRQALLRLARRWHLHLKAGQLSIERRLSPTGVGGLVRAARELAAVSGALAGRVAPFGRLEHNALNDPQPNVRLNNIDILARDRRQRAAVLREALLDPSEKVRVRAAVWLGVEGRETLLDLLNSPTLEPESAAEAIRSLGAHLPEARGLELLGRALDEDRRSVARAAAESLGHAGTTSAVPALRAVIDDHPLDFALRRAANEAIARIQSRLEGAEAGQLSVAEAEAGELSLSDSAAGRLSLDQPTATDRHRATKTTREC